MRFALDRGAEYLWLLNNDTTVTPDALSNLLAEAEKYPDAGIAASKIYYFDSPEKIWFAGAEIFWLKGISDHIGIGETDIGQYNRIREMDRVTGCSMLVKKAVCSKVGLFDEKFFLYDEEVDWCVRSRKAGFKCIYVPASVIYHKASVSVRKTGVWSKVYDYYHTRNFLYLVRKSFFSPIREILLALLIIRKLRYEKRNIVKMLLASFNPSFKIPPGENPALFAVKDFLTGKFGKNTYQFKSPVTRKVRPRGLPAHGNVHRGHEGN